ncbi:MAG: FapA family protein [Myxococcota bacterium]
MDARDRIQIRVSDDGLEAWLTIAPGDRGDAAAFRERLAELGVVAGLDEKTLDDAARAYASEAGMKQERRIAQGTPPTPADPPRLELQDPAGPIAGTRREDGSLDFRERQLILPVRRDDVLGRIVAATEGKPGLDVHGDPIEPEPPAELVVKHGEGVAIDDEGQLLAVRDGARTLGPDGTIDVVAHHVHPGHVDLKSGNLTTRGSLEIKRDVTANMHVRAGFDLRVGGTVDGARVEAGGSIEVGAGVIGRGRRNGPGRRRPSVRHALGARLECGGLLRVTRSVSTSTLVARDRGRGASARRCRDGRAPHRRERDREQGRRALRAARRLAPRERCRGRLGASARPRAQRDAGRRSHGTRGATGLASCAQGRTRSDLPRRPRPRPARERARPADRLAPPSTRSAGRRHDRGARYGPRRLPPRLRHHAPRARARPARTKMAPLPNAIASSARSSRPWTSNASVPAT